MLFATHRPIFGNWCKIPSFTLNGKIISDDTMTPRLVKKVLGACPIYNNKLFISKHIRFQRCSHMHRHTHTNVRYWYQNSHFFWKLMIWSNWEKTHQWAEIFCFNFETFLRAQLFEHKLATWRLMRVTWHCKDLLLFYIRSNWFVGIHIWMVVLKSKPKLSNIQCLYTMFLLHVSLLQWKNLQMKPCT